MDIAVVATLIGLTVGLISITATIVKATTAIVSLRHAIGEVEDKVERLRSDGYHEIEKLALTSNGIRERMEHINTRLSNQHRDIGASLSDIETFLVKTTAYEKRRNS